MMLHNDKRVNIQRKHNSLKVYAPNLRATKYLRQKLIKFQRQINSSVLMVGYFNTPLTEMDKSAGKNISKSTVEFLRFFKKFT